MAKKRMEETVYTPAQKKAVDYFRKLCETDPEEAREELGRIIKMWADGAKIVGTELAKVYDKLGYYGAEEVSKSTWDFCDELTGMYIKIHR